MRILETKNLMIVENRPCWLLFYKQTVAAPMDPIISNQICIQVTAKYKT